MNSAAQAQKTIDSLKSVLEKAQDNRKPSLLIDLATEFASADSEQSLIYLEEAYARALQFGDSASLVRAGWIQGELWKRKEFLDKAIDRLTYILPIAERNGFRKDQKRILNTLAVISTYKANYDIALEYNFKSLNLREKDGDKAGMTISYNNIGLNYFRLSNYELALSFYDKALRLKKEVNNSYDLDRLLINMGLCYSNIGEYKKAKQVFYDGLSICKEDCDPSIAVEAEYGLGLSSYGLNEPVEAAEHLKKSLDGALQLNDKRNQLESLILLSKVYYDLGDFNNSKKYLDQALIAVKITAYNGALMTIYKQYSLLADTEKDFEKASNYRKLYIQLRDSIYSENMIKNLAAIQTNFVEKENLATIEANRIVIDQQKTITLSVVCIALLLCIILYLIYSQRRRIASVNDKLNKRVDKATLEIFEEHEKLKKIIEERDYFMYKTSHDIRGPLATFMGLINIAKLDVVEPLAVSYLDRLEVTGSRLNTILSRLQFIEKISHRIIEYNFLDFQEILDDIINLEKRKLPSDRLSISYEIEPNLIAKGDRYLLNLILENLISNSIKFYNDSLRIVPFVKISVFTRGDKLVIQVVDNGIGIDPEMAPKIFQLFVRASERSETGGVGLYISKMAAEKLEGKIEFTALNEATQFEVIVPRDLGPILRKQRELEMKFEDRRAKSNKDQPLNLSLVFS